MIGLKQYENLAVMKDQAILCTLRSKGYPCPKMEPKCTRRFFIRTYIPYVTKIARKKKRCLSGVAALYELCKCFV